MPSGVRSRVSKGDAAGLNESTVHPLWLVFALLCLCAVIYVAFARVGGTGLRSVFIVLAAYAGWRLGFWLGMSAALVIAPTIIALTAIAGLDVSSMLSVGAVVGLLVLMGAGATAGRLHDLDSARAAAEAALRAQRDYALQQHADAEHARAETLAVLDASAEVMVLVDTKRRFRLVNRAFQEILGIAPEQVVGRDWRELRPVVDKVFADPDGFIRLVAGSAADPVRRFVADVRQRWPEERELEMTSAPVVRASLDAVATGAPLGRLYLFRDVTSDREVARLREAQRQSLEADLARAARLQADLLPHGSPTNTAFDFAARCLPAQAIGGDFFDWHEPMPGVLTVTLGDIMGKGLSAALLMATVRAAFEAVSDQSTPAGVLQAVAHATQRDLERAEAFVTLFHARIDRSFRVTYADAGHGYVFVRRATGEVEALAARGLPLGIFTHQTFPEGAVELAPNDALVIYSDGLADICPDLAVLAAQLKGASSAAGIMDRLITIATSGPPLPDDLTIVVLRRREVT